MQSHFGLVDNSNEYLGIRIEDGNWSKRIYSRDFIFDNCYGFREALVYKPSPFFANNYTDVKVAIFLFKAHLSFDTPEIIIFPITPNGKRFFRESIADSVDAEGNVDYPFRGNIEFCVEHFKQHFEIGDLSLYNI